MFRCSQLLVTYHAFVIIIRLCLCRYQLSCLSWKSLVIWYAVYSHQKMAQTVSPLTRTAMVTLKWLDLKTLQQQTLCQQTLETWQMQNLSVLTSVSKLHPIRVFKPHSWYLFYSVFPYPDIFFSLHYTLFMCMYLFYNFL